MELRSYRVTLPPTGNPSLDGPTSPDLHEACLQLIIGDHGDLSIIDSEMRVTAAYAAGQWLRVEEVAR